MAEPVLTILGETIRLPCRDEDEARVRDLADALARRVETIASDSDQNALRALALAALQLLDEGQRAGAALARAHAEIDRLNDLLAQSRSQVPREPQSSPVPVQR